MIDLAYVLGTVAFFGLTLTYVRACERLGRGGSRAERPEGLRR